MKPRRWSPERDALVQRDYPADVSRELIAAACNRLEGRTVASEHVSMRAGVLHLHRSPSYLRELGRSRIQMMANARHYRSRSPSASVNLDLTGVPKTTQLLTGTPGVALPPVPERWDIIQATALRDEACWLGHQGDLISYNRKRIARGKAPFVVERR